jgi:putative IMPACT (imprinted ancient) family translation regulator
VVIRYFGGTKLGVSGLINAYKTTAKQALDAAIIVERTINDVYRLNFGYEQMNNVMKILKDENLDQCKHQFEMQCSLVFSVRKNDGERIVKAFRKLKDTKIDYLRTE